MINSTQENNKLYYGKLYLTSDIKITGDINTPIVDANLTVNDKTDLTIVLPNSDPSLEDRKGVVEFINPNEPKTDSILLAKQLDSLRKSDLNGLDVSATIRVNKNAKFTIVVDQNNGDIVQLRGEAQLNGGIDPSGKTNLTGTYTVESGSYNLSYASVNRKFNFKKGSTITWTGDPTSANIDLTATYIANVPPIDLVSNQLSGTENQTMYKQKLPFNVDLNLKNELLKPNISFDIVLPDSTYTVSQDVINNVNSRLNQIRQDTNEMNKQVLGVLVLGHFIGDNPLQSQGGNSGVQGLVRNSVSSMLSDQLNRLAGNLIAGVDLNFGLTSGEDYSSGTAQNRTDLNVGLSKRFLNDRLTVTVGNNFNLEGNQPGEKSTDIAGNVSVNYLLSKDGRYALRAYRRDEFEVIEGQIVETGVAFTLTVDYNRFMQIFAGKSKKDKELQDKYKQDQKEKDQKDKELKDQQAAAQPLKAHDSFITTEKQFIPMKKHLFYIVILSLLLNGCSTVKYLAPGQKLYTGGQVTIPDTDENVTAKDAKGISGELTDMLRPKPNKKVLALRVKLWIYYKTKTNKKKGLSHWLNTKFGEPPVLISEVDVNKNAQILQNRLQNEGYFQAQVNGDTTSKGKIAKAIYTASPGPNYTIRKIVFPPGKESVDTAIAASAPKTLFKVDDNYNLDIIKDERIRIDARLKEEGFYYFAPEDIIMRVDSNVGDHKVDIYVKVKDATPDKARNIYTIDHIYVYPHYTIRDTSLKLDSAVKYLWYNMIDTKNTIHPYVFKNTVLLHPGDVYSRSEHNKTLNRFVNLGPYKFVKNKFEDVSEDSSKLNFYYFLTPYPKNHCSWSY